MVKELSMGSGSTTAAPTVKIDKLNNTSMTNNKASSNTLTTVVKKEGEVKTSTKSEPLPTTSPFSFDNLYSGIKGQGKVEDVKGNDVTKSKETIVIKDNSTPTTSTPTTSTPTTSTTDTTSTSTTDTTSTNADVMKEVISIDKKEEQIDDTKSLDIFFSDIQKMANPSLNAMEPIKEETKYTLFEDASEKE